MIILPISTSWTGNIPKSYHHFWTWFQKNEQSFFHAAKEGRYSDSLIYDLQQALSRIKEGLHFQLGMADAHTAELLITAEGWLENIPFAEDLIGVAPMIAGWQFTALKQPTNCRDIILQAEGYQFDMATLHFYSFTDPGYSDEINLVITHPNATEENQTIIHKGVSVFLDTCLGELNFATSIDYFTVEATHSATAQLIPIERLSSYVTWRQAEFVERYGGEAHYDSSNDTYNSFIAKRQDGLPLVATINTDMLTWKAKAAYPWVLIVEVAYNSSLFDKMPDAPTSTLLDELEQQLISELPETAGYLFVGRQTAAGIQEIYFTCCEFRQPARVLYHHQQQCANGLKIKYSLYLDRYWRAFERFAIMQ